MSNVYPTCVCTYYHAYSLTYQWARITVGSQVVNEHSEMCWLVLQLVQVTERAMLIKLT